MKIVHISVYPYRNEKHGNAGGVASYTKNLVINIPIGKDDEVFVLCNKLDGRKEQYAEGKIKIIRCFDKNSKFFFQLFREVRKINPNIIHFQQELALFGNVFTAYLLQWLLFLLRSYRIVITLHGVVSLKKVDKKFISGNSSSLPVWIVKIALRVIYKPLCTWVRKIIVHEEYFKQILIDEYGVDSSKIEVIHHGVEDIQPIQKEIACRNLNLDSKKNIILFMGYLTGYKGIDLLIEGFSLYAQKNPNAFLIIGAGEHPKLKSDLAYKKEYNRYKKKAQDMIPANQFRWVGFISESDIIAYYSASDVSIYPYTVSMSSSGPMAIAIGLEKPFLASDVFCEIIEKRVLFSQVPECLSAKIENFFIDQEEYLQHVENMKENRVWSHTGYLTGALYASIKSGKNI